VFRVQVLGFTVYCLRFTVYHLRFTIYSLRFRVWGLRFTFYVLRFIFYVLRFTFYVLRLTVHGFGFWVWRLGEGVRVPASPDVSRTKIFLHTMSWMHPQRDNGAAIGRETSFTSLSNTTGRPIGTPICTPDEQVGRDVRTLAA